VWRALCQGALAGIVLVELHGPSGQVLELNPAEVSSLREPLAVPGHWARNTHCIIVMTNGRVIAIAEDCVTAKARLQQ
jgi:hypothetical protein